MRPWWRSCNFYGKNKKSIGRKLMSKAPAFSVSPALLLKWVPIAALLTTAYYSGFLWMVERWSARASYYGHGFLIPLVPLYWLFKKREKLASLPQEFGGFGLIFLLTGGLLHAVSSFLRIYFL